MNLSSMLITRQVFCVASYLSTKINDGRLTDKVFVHVKLNLFQNVKLAGQRRFFCVCGGRVGGCSDERKNRAKNGAHG